MTISFLIRGSLFSLIVAALLGALVWSLFRTKMSALCSGVLITALCALLVFVTRSLCQLLSLTDFIRHICSLLITPYAVVWFSGAIPWISLAFVFQILIMGFIGMLTWLGMKSLSASKK